MGRDEMRASDADRQAVADQLRTALDDGRLDLHEYDERLQQTYAAKTFGDLDPLLSDLPAASVPMPVQRRPAGSTVPAVEDSDAALARRWVLEVWAGWLPVVGLTTAIWLVSCIAAQDLLYFWPGWVAGPWAVFLVYATVAGLANGEPRKQVEKRARKEQAKQLKRERKALERQPAGQDDVLPTDRERD